MRVLENSIVNVQWNWKLDEQGNPPEGKRKAVEVPNEIIDTGKEPSKLATLKSFIELTNEPQFQMKFKYRSDSNPSTVLTVKGMMFDSYYNYINVEANTPTGNDFRGVFGLGERASKDFFLQNGVYTMWSRDQPTPDETGTLPGNNMYGTHPYFMYKHKKDAWVGVLYKLAHA
jgi:Galactose mutarotase-like